MPNGRLVLLFIVSLIACCIEVDISVPSFPVMENYFHVSSAMIQSTLTINFLGFCLAALFYGPLSDCFGRRKIMLIGNTFLMIGALGCVVASSIYVLLFFRFIQGIGAATSAVVVFAMIADRYDGIKATKIIGIMNAVLTIVMAMAPTVGAFMTQSIGWRGNYGVVALITVLAWLFLLLGLEETKKELVPIRLKTVLHNYQRLLSSSKFISASLVPSLLYAAYLCFISTASFLYMQSLGLSIVSYAPHQTIIVAVFSCVSLLSGRCIEKLGSKNCVHLGITLAVMGAISLTLLGLFNCSLAYLITAAASIFSIGFALCYPVIFSRSLEIFPDIKGTASSLIMSMRTLICASFIGMTAYLYNGDVISVAGVMLGAVLLSVCFSLKLRWEKMAEREGFEPSVRR